MKKDKKASNSRLPHASSNPFIYGKVVREEEFCPRPQELKALKNSILSGQNMALLGERRIGKTSLLKEAVRNTKRHTELYVDLMQIKSIEDLIKRFFHAIHQIDTGFFDKTLKFFSVFKPVVTFDPASGKTGFSLSPGQKIAPESLSAIFKLLKEIHQKKPLVVILDEFQDILHLDCSSECLAILRSEIQFLEKIPFWYSGSVRESIHGIFLSPDSPFYKSAQMIEIGPLPEEAFMKFLQAKFEVGGRTVSSSLLKEMIVASSSVPGDVQEYCSALWEVSDFNSTLEQSHREAALECIFSREIKEYESYLLNLSSMQYRALYALATVGGIAIQSQVFLQKAEISLPAGCQKAVDRLIELRIVYRHNKEYKFINPFFRQWLLHRGY